MSTLQAAPTVKERETMDPQKKRTATKVIKGGNKFLKTVLYILDSVLFLLCCLPTPMTLASGGSPMFPLVVHQLASLASSAVTPAGSVHIFMGDNGVRMWVQLKRWCVWMLQRGHSGDGCVLASTLSCVSMIWGREICLFLVGKGATSEAGKSLQSC